MTKKYLLCVGHVESKNDGELHFIGASTLARLYKVPMNECVVWDHHKYPTWWMAQACKPKGLIELYPSYHGNYDQPKSHKPVC